MAIRRPLTNGTTSAMDPRTGKLLALTGISVDMLTGISVDMRNTPVLRFLDLGLDSGAALGIVGANGSGKTTLLQLAATLLRPVAGSASVLGADLRGRIPTPVRRAICLIGHQAALYPQLRAARGPGRAAVLVAQLMADVRLCGGCARRLPRPSPPGPARGRRSR